MLTKDITVFQLKAARAGLGLTATDLHKRTGIGRATITRIESQDMSKPPKCNLTTVYHLKTFLETCGVVFENQSKISFVAENAWDFEEK
ncbi:hypothetical protein FACS1894122_07960 [Alphaproteobacteria bacterium]|nr:hypothetical protein FACS1894122_07960 [Alphaproteobacteria bacterium]